MALHEQCTGATDEWYTPPHVFKAMGCWFDLDPCSPGVDHWAPATWIFTKKENSLTKNWSVDEWDCRCLPRCSVVAHALRSSLKMNSRPGENRRADADVRADARPASASEQSQNKQLGERTPSNAIRSRLPNYDTYDPKKVANGNDDPAPLETLLGETAELGGLSSGALTCGNSANLIGITAAPTAETQPPLPKIISSPSRPSRALEQSEATWCPPVAPVITPNETPTPPSLSETKPYLTGSCPICGTDQKRSRPALVFMNPPFGGRNALVPWLEKFFAHGNGIALTPDRTSAPWWQRFAPRADLILFVAPKLKFIGADGKPGASPAQGTCLMAIGRRAHEPLYRAEANGLGVLMRAANGQRLDEKS